MAKADLGKKRQCPKCGTRFYDLGKDDPIVCVSCSQKFEPELILKPRNRPAPQIVPKPEKKVEAKVADSDEVEDSAADDDDSAADGDLGTVLEIDDDDDDDIAVEVDPNIAKDEPA